MKMMVAMYLPKVAPVIQTTTPKTKIYRKRWLIFLLDLNVTSKKLSKSKKLKINFLVVWKINLRIKCLLKGKLIKWLGLRDRSSWNKLFRALLMLKEKNRELYCKIMKILKGKTLSWKWNRGGQTIKIGCRKTENRLRCGRVLIKSLL